eukprot:1413476-Karenia_brevis.AAC.1
MHFLEKLATHKVLYIDAGAHQPSPDSVYPCLRLAGVESSLKKHEFFGKKSMETFVLRIAKSEPCVENKKIAIFISRVCLGTIIHIIPALLFPKKFKKWLFRSRGIDGEAPTRIRVGRRWLGFAKNVPKRRSRSCLMSPPGPGHSSHFKPVQASSRHCKSLQALEINFKSPQVIRRVGRRADGGRGEEGGRREEREEEGRRTASQFEPAQATASHFKHLKLTSSHL